MSKKNVSASAVRIWANDNMDKVDAAGHLSLTGANGVVRGRLHPKVIEAFNRANKGKKYDPTVKVAPEASLIKHTVIVESKTGRKVPRTVTFTAAEARTLAGVPVKRGRLSQEVKDAAALAKIAG